MRGENHFVARLNPGGAEADDQPVGGIRHAKRILDAQIGREGFLEFGEVTLLNKGTATKDVADDVNELVFARRESAAIVEERDRCLSGFP